MEIKKGIPFPLKQNTKVAPYHALEVGDCIAHGKNLLSAKCLAYQASGRTDQKKVFRAALLNGVPHIWRIK